jgi:hypothetical protein
VLVCGAASNGASHSTVPQDIALMEINGTQYIPVDKVCSTPGWAVSVSKHIHLRFVFMHAVDWPCNLLCNLSI